MLNYRQNDDAAGEVPVAFVVGFDLTEEAVKDFIAKQVYIYDIILIIHKRHSCLVFVLKRFNSANTHHIDTNLPEFIYIYIYI